MYTLDIPYVYLKFIDMKKIKKNILFYEVLRKQVQDYADKHCDNNFNLAVRQLIKKGLENELLN